MAKRTEPNDWGLPEASRATACAVCEAMLPDAVDGLLNEAEQKAFDKHVTTCLLCAEEFQEAQRGAAWLHMLKGHTPEPSPMLLNRILAQTTGVEAIASPLMRDEAAHECATPDSVLMMTPDGTIGSRVVAQSSKKSMGAAIGRKLVDIFSIQKATVHFQPRLAMTAAMAFFSVALTLNMTGIKLGNLKASNLRPSTLRRTVADTTASAMRSFQNLRVVYQFESRLEDLRDTGSGNGQMQTPSSYGEPSPAAKPDGSQGDVNKESDTHRGSKGHSLLQFPLLRPNASTGRRA